MSLPTKLALSHAYADEGQIVWLQDPAAHHYLLERIFSSDSRERRPRQHVGRLVAYSTIRPGARRRPPYSRHYRRAWWIIPGRADTADWEDAVLTSSVAAGRPSTYLNPEP